MELKKSYLESHPDKNGYFGKFGGIYISPQLEKPFKEITDVYNRLSKSHDYISELRAIKKHYQGRPTPVHFIGSGIDYLSKENLKESILVNLSGRGDKDIDFVVEYYLIPEKQEKSCFMI